MVEENLQEHRLPEDFTQEVVQEALARGRHLLQERQWPEARKAFNRIVAAVPDHLEAHRGLALAFDGAFSREALRQDVHFSDGRLLDNTFAALHKVCELGAGDPEVARALGQLYSHYGRHEEGGQCLERAADHLDDWRRSVPLYKMAISVYYHAHYTGRGDHMEACVRCHRRARQFVPADWPPRRRFALWQPSGMSMAYAHLGLSQEVFDELDVLKTQSEDEWSVEDALPILRHLLQSVPRKWVDGARWRSIVGPLSIGPRPCLPTTRASRSDPWRSPKKATKMLARTTETISAGGPRATHSQTASCGRDTRREEQPRTSSPNSTGHSISTRALDLFHRRTVCLRNRPLLGGAALFAPRGGTGRSARQSRRHLSGRRTGRARTGGGGEGAAAQYLRPTRGQRNAGSARPLTRSAGTRTWSNWSEWVADRRACEVPRGQPILRRCYAMDPRVLERKSTGAAPCCSDDSPLYSSQLARPLSVV